MAYWKTLATDPDAEFDREVTFDVGALAPAGYLGHDAGGKPARRRRRSRSGAGGGPRRAARGCGAACAIWGLSPARGSTQVPIDRVFIGSCTNGRLEDLRQAAAVLAGRRVAPNVAAIVVPGSATVRLQAEAEGLDRVFRDAGFEWRDSGCSMCVAMNDDRLQSGERCASTSNRNFEGRQGPNGRTHLMSPAMAAAAAISGRLADVRILESVRSVA